MENFRDILLIIAPVISAVLVALLNNWDKINPARKQTAKLLELAEANAKDKQEVKQELAAIQGQMKQLSSAQRTGLQTQILEKCRAIQLAVKDGETDYSEELKQLIILYREYHMCGFNSQGKLYFNDTIQIVSDHDNVLVRELMNTLFPEYEP